jgi:thiamine-phosphate pyrophosphorylase
VSALPPATVHLITHRRLLAPDARTMHAEIAALEAFLDEAIAAGVDVIQIRERDLPPQAQIALVRSVILRARGTAVRVLVNDRADIAMAAGADGVHLRADAVPSARVRTLSAAWTLGRSMHDGDDAAGPESSAIDYWLFAPVFAPMSKGPEAGAAGLAALARVTAASPRPVVALGGIDATRAAACAAAGAAGVGAISVFLPAGRAPGAIGPARAVGALRAALLSGSASTGRSKPR